MPTLGAPLIAAPVATCFVTVFIRQTLIEVIGRPVDNLIMDIRPPLPADRLGPVTERPAAVDRAVRELLSALKPGQSLPARVLAVPRADLALLLIDGLTVNARTGRPLLPGQQLTLTVLKAGVAPELEIRPAARLPATQDILRQALPRQLPLADTMTQIGQTADRALPLLNGAARQALRNLVARDQPLREPTATQLRQAVRDSGLFTEANLARGQAPQSGDRKALLLQLASALPARGGPRPLVADTPPITDRATLARVDALPEPLTRSALLTAARGMPLGGGGPEGLPSTPVAPVAADPDAQVLARLWRLVEASLARIQVHQAASLPRDDAPQQAWQLDVPIALPGGPTQVIELRIQGDSPQAESTAADAGWLVTVGFVFPGLGPVKAGVRLAEGRISTSFWCEQDAAARLFQAHLPRLQSALEAAGLEVGHLAANQGLPPDTAPSPPDGLLDERV